MMENDVLWKINSRYAEVSCFKKEDSLWVEKIISPHGNKDALWINEVSIFFRKKLYEKNVPLAFPYEYDTRNGFSIQTSLYVGQDTEKLMKLNKKDKRNQLFIIEKIISAIGNILVSKSFSPEVGIDALLPNFCINENGKLYYVDTFPPLVRYEGSYIVHFPNPTEEKIIQSELFRKFNPKGIMRRLRFSILENSELIDEEDILFIVSEILGKDFARELKEYFLSLPHNSNGESLKSIERLDTDSIREIGLKKTKDLNPKERREFLENIFELSSSFCPLKITSEERVIRLKEILV